MFLPISSKIRATWVPFLHPMQTEARDLQRSQTKSMVLRPLIPRQSVNTPRTPMREAPQIHHWGPLLLSVTSHLLEHSPEIRDRKFFRSIAGISLPRGFDDSGSDGQGVCNTKVRPKPFPVTFVWGVFCILWVQYGAGQALRTLFYTSPNAHASPRDWFPNHREGRELLLKKKLIICPRNGSSMGKYGFGHFSFYSNYFWFCICRWVCACKCMRLRIP